MTSLAHDTHQARFIVASHTGPGWDVISAVCGYRKPLTSAVTHSDACEIAAHLEATTIDHHWCHPNLFDSQHTALVAAHGERAVAEDIAATVSYRHGFGDVPGHHVYGDPGFTPFIHSPCTDIDRAYRHAKSAACQWIGRYFPHQVRASSAHAFAHHVGATAASTPTPATLSDNDISVLWDGWRGYPVQR